MGRAGRALKRVPLDFGWPLYKPWYGYLHESFSFCSDDDNYMDEDSCEYCRKYAEIKGIPLDGKKCPEFNKYYGVPEKLPVEPPEGEGYQMWEIWEILTGGCPASPVFKTFDELIEWCTENVSPLGLGKGTADQWRKLLSNTGDQANAGT